YDEAKCKDAEVEIAVQLNGKIKARIMIPAESTADEAINLAKENADVKALLDGMQVIKEFYAPKKLVNIVVKPL
ncbi:MAG: leucine--tRNA ligase, partial [Clostridia bacterium]|nr:leucine--tRNA ligase [Clostridia bacterium]